MTEEEQRKSQVLGEVFDRFKIVEASDNPGAHTTLNKEEISVLCECIRTLRDR